MERAVQGRSTSPLVPQLVEAGPGTAAGAARATEEAVRAALQLASRVLAAPAAGARFGPDAPAGLPAGGVWHLEEPDRLSALVEAASATGAFDFNGSEPAEGAVLRLLDPGDAVDAAALACGLVAAVTAPIPGPGGATGAVEVFTSPEAGTAATSGDLAAVVALAARQVAAVLEVHRAGAERASAEAHLRSLVESAPDALLVVGDSGTILFANAEAERLTGYDRDLLHGRPVEVLLPEARRRSHALHRAGYESSPVRRPMGAGRELRLRRSDGTEVEVDVSLAPSDLGDGPVVLATVRDVGDRSRAVADRLASERRLAEAERLAQLGSWSWDVATGTSTWSDELFRILGREPAGSGPAPDDYLQLVHPGDRERIAADFASALADARPFEHEYRVVPGDGTVRWVHVRGEVVAGDDGRPRLVRGFCQDVTSRRSAQRDLWIQQALLEQIARGVPLRSTLERLCLEVEERVPGTACTVLLLDRSSGVLHTAAAPSLPGGFVAELERRGVPVGTGACGAAAATGRVAVVEETRNDPRLEGFTDLTERYGIRSIWSLPVLDESGDVLGTFAVYRDEPRRPDTQEVAVVEAAGRLAALAIDRDRSQRALHDAANLDPVTGLTNRRQLLRRLEAALQVPGARITVMFLDLDRFKWVNDSLGHPAGDAILAEVGARLRRVLRDTDVVARFGGDEFVVLALDTPVDVVVAMADRVSEAFEAPFPLAGGEFFLTVSIGIATSDGASPKDADGLLRDADTAMYEAKERGRGRHAVFDDRLRRRAVGRVSLEGQLRRALERDELSLHYQPIRHLASGRWVGAEALARWRHPERGLVAPGDFIDLAEETGLIIPIGQRLLERVVAQAAAWVRAGQPLEVAVNISAVQLADPGIAADIRRLLVEHDLPPGLLVVEITETGVMEDLATAQQALDRIAAIGVRTLVDDFGTGYSSIARLRDLPVSGVKVDRSFTARVGRDADADDVLGAITHLAQTLRLAVVVEGIESAVGLARAEELGCDYGQGFHLCPPLRPDELLGRIAPGPAGAG